MIRNILEDSLESEAVKEVHLAFGKSLKCNFLVSSRFPTCVTISFAIAITISTTSASARYRDATQTGKRHGVPLVDGKSRGSYG